MRALINSFRYAFRGVLRTIRSERNFRIHLVCMVYMYAFLELSDWFTITRTDWALLFFANALVLAAELFNTAVEALVDLATRRQHPLAATAKDCAAGGVLVCALCAAAVGVAVLFQPEAFASMFEYFRTHVWMLLAFVFSLGISAVFIFVKKK
ncbi:MAG: diacylglycerol kinase family protein [Oscillospiraceae bacterium]|jgi:diacylglycerol kinase (ATP)|nr:diacylglycerol kinase family protein [Oscillospiraceae bacterium]